MLLFQAYYSYQKESLTSPILLIGTVLFASSLTADRMYPSYEPIYGGWFQEIGTFLLVVSIGYELWQDLSKTYRAKLLLEEETHYLAKQIEIQKAHYQELTERIDESIRLRHDHRHHMQTVTTYLQNNEREKHWNTWHNTQSKGSRKDVSYYAVICSRMRFYNTIKHSAKTTT